MRERGSKGGSKGGREGERERGREAHYRTCDTSLEYNKAQYSILNYTTLYRKEARSSSEINVLMSVYIPT